MLCRISARQAVQQAVLRTPASLRRCASTQARPAARLPAAPHSFTPSAPAAPHSPGQRLQDESASGPPPGQYPDRSGFSSHQDAHGYQHAAPAPADARARATSTSTAGGVRQANKVAPASLAAGANAAHGMGAVSQAYAEAQEQAAFVSNVRPFEVTDYKDTYSNVLTLTGRLGQDPHVLRFEDRQLAKLSLAFKQANNTDGWMNIEAWSPLAEQCEAYLRKGMRVQVSGKVKVDKWIDKDTGKNRQAHILLASTFWLVEGGPEGEGAASNASEADLWLQFKDRPDLFWDNRDGKRNPRAPDYKHKESGQGLWLDSFSRPNWITAEGDVLY